MHFDLINLNLVLAIADRRSITACALRENLALAAARERLKELEARFGVRLFERRARVVESPETGRALVRHVRSLHASLHALAHPGRAASGAARFVSALCGQSTTGENQP
jgi:DNA-binding transcriptional LysR family regulator